MREHQLYENNDRDVYFEKCRTFIKAWKAVKASCSEIISLYGRTNHYLIRAIAADLPPIWRGHSTVRQEERGERREEVDAWLTAHHFTALRSNSIFCSNTLDQAFIYAGETGKRFYILPMNGFHYTWYNNHADLYQLNFNATLGREDLTVDELMHMAQPRQDGIEEMLNTHAHRELHFVGSYWAFDMDLYGQMVRDELNGAGFSKQARYMPDDVRVQLGFKPLGKKP